MSYHEFLREHSSIFFAFLITIAYTSVTILILSEAARDEQFVQAVGVVLSSITTIILAVLYFRQTKLISEQNRTQKLQKSPRIQLENSDYITGHQPNAATVSEVVRLVIANTGEGPAMEPKFIFNSKVTVNSGDQYSTQNEGYLLREDFDSLHDSLHSINQKESEIGFVPFNEIVMKYKQDYYQIEEYLAKHRDEIQSIEIDVTVSVGDIHGDSKDPFGNEYRDSYGLRLNTDFSNTSKSDLAEALFNT